MNRPELKIIGTVRSSLKTLDDCPLQGAEGAPEAWLEIDAAFADAIKSLEPGQELIVLTWFHLADRSVLTCYPRKQTDVPHIGVFSTRSPDRPNPIGLHQVTIRDIQAQRIQVHPLEALDGTPVIDIKPVIS
jgi:putative methyltransferase, YaeB/AF_0241 family